MGGMHVPNGMDFIHLSYATCFREDIGQAIFVSFELLSPCGMNYLHLMRTLEEQFMEGWIGKNLAYGGSLSHIGVTNAGREYLQHSPYKFLEEKQHLGVRTVIFPISPKLMGIFISILFFCFTNKNVKEAHNTPKQ